MKLFQMVNGLNLEKIQTRRNSGKLNFALMRIHHASNVKELRRKGNSNVPNVKLATILIRRNTANHVNLHQTVVPLVMEINSVLNVNSDQSYNLMVYNPLLAQKILTSFQLKSLLNLNKILLMLFVKPTKMLRDLSILLVNFTGNVLHVKLLMKDAVFALVTLPLVTSNALNVVMDTSSKMVSAKLVCKTPMNVSIVLLSKSVLAVTTVLL